MGSRFTVRYHYVVEEQDIPRLSHEWRMRIRRIIETKLTVYPDIFGKPLRRSLAGCRKLRVEDYRVIFTITGQEVQIWAIGHRRNVYQLIARRLRDLSGLQ